MILRSNRSVRRFGLFQAAKWICLIFLVYMCVLYVWKVDKLASSDNDRSFIRIPRPRRLEVEHNKNQSSSSVLQLLNATTSTYIDLKSPIAVLVFCATREQAIRNHLTQLLKQRPSASLFPIYVSQDSDSMDVHSAIMEFANQTQNLHYMQHTKRTPTTAGQKAAKNYFHIAQHYKWALAEVFKKHETVIVTEDDLDIAPDFFNYFASTKQILDRDPTVFCISGWNDNGGRAVVDQTRSDLLYRTDFFPGLGWMLKADAGRKLLDEWPDAYWDDWLRKPEVRKNRVCIRPEISRTAHNNRLAGKGSSNGMYKSYLASIRLPDSAVDFSLVDMSRLEKRKYDAVFRQQLLDAKPIEIGALIEQARLEPDHSHRCEYSNPRDFRRVADKFKLMNDFRGGMTRTAYYGIVSFMTSGVRVFLVPKKLDLQREFSNYTSDQVYELEWDLMNRFLDFQATYCKPGKWAGTCDPKSTEMRAWFDRKRMKKRLDAWGEMIVF